MKKITLLEAAAYAIETLCIFPLMDAQGAIKAIVEADVRVWNHINAEARDVLINGIGLTPPNQNP